MSGEDLAIHRLAAFTDDPAGGNPAGVVITDEPLPEDRMQRIAAEVGYSETAFLAAPAPGRRAWQVRYFSPVSEVPFCGHATIASAVQLGREVGAGAFAFHLRSGTVDVEVADREGRPVATLRSVTPEVQDASAELATEVLSACGVGGDVLDDRYPPAVAFAGARHLLLVLREREVLRGLAYDFDRLLAAMRAEDLTTVAYLWPDQAGRWHARNLFPIGGVVEDPATGAAAAAFGAYLRAIGAIEPPASFEILQGEDLGRPASLRVTVPAGTGGIDVAGTAVDIT